MAAALQAAREQERACIARDIHDELGQTLTAIRFGIERVRLLIGEAPPHPTDMRDVIEGLDRLARGAIGTIQRIASDLRPPEVDEVGLLGAIEQMTRRMARQTGLRILVTHSLDASTEERLDPERATAAYRIVQEALTNVARHAEATTVAVRLGSDGGALGTDLCIEVTDDGIGIRHEASGGSITERARHWHGQATLTVSPAGGTVVRATIPLGSPLNDR